MIDDGSLVMLGVIQEQHADRCRLFQQWKQLDFPIVQDSLNTNGIAVVPVYVAIDQFGIVRGKYRRFSDFQKVFLQKEFSEVATEVPKMDKQHATVKFWKTQSKWVESPMHLAQTADAMIHWQGSQLDAVKQAIGYYELAAEKYQQGEPQAVPYSLNFRMGVAKRLHYELDGQKDPELFRDSVLSWETALKQNPNQYIYRRRIEQYGPRLKKPYSFYDWVEEARKEIQERGETPVPLKVEPNGAELAQRARQMSVQEGAKNPDPHQQVELVQDQVKVHVNSVPTQPQPGAVAAVHLGFHLVEGAKWNHESTPLQVWLEKPTGDTALSAQWIEDKTPRQESTSEQPISISLELKMPTDGAQVKLKGYALFHICETDSGQCVFRRKNFELMIQSAAD